MYIIWLLICGINGWFLCIQNYTISMPEYWIETSIVMAAYLIGRETERDCLKNEVKRKE